ncbi:hypothetical protein [Sporosarcina sp. ZBG7A]|uniref:hypothetical protein n=1 Tax=Sporosarcina sp. ZBG7A TaxID=1582223 RepID=UPI00057B5EAD|nr:hypothetical protein [Sporosarcina sp. ZBG7A]
MDEIEAVMNLWNNSMWYQQIYVGAGVLFILSLGASLLLAVPYFKVEAKVQKEYNMLCQKHFFIKLRSNKQVELLQIAKLNVRNCTRIYPFYLIQKLVARIITLSLGIAITFYIGSSVFIFLETPIGEEDMMNPPIIEEDDDHVEPTVNTDDGIHHVEPHPVESYTRSDGTEVQGYHRGGSDGYDRSNPDNSTSNNLKP